MPLPLAGGLGPFTTDPGSVVTANWQVIASAATITPLGPYVRVTGNTTINTITPPNMWFNGPLYLLNTDASVGATGTSGNIALATTLVRYKVCVMVYDPSVSKWYPSY